MLTYEGPWTETRVMDFTTDRASSVNLWEQVYLSSPKLHLIILFLERQSHPSEDTLVTDQKQRKGRVEK